MSKLDTIVTKVAESLQDANQPGNIEAQISHLMNCVRQDALAHDGKMAANSELAENRLKALIGLALKDARGSAADALTSEQRQTIEWAAERAHIQSLGKPVYGVEWRRWRVLSDLCGARPAAAAIADQPDEHAKAERDRTHYGMSIMVDGIRVAPERVTFRERAPVSTNSMPRVVRAISDAQIKRIAEQHWSSCRFVEGESFLAFDDSDLAQFARALIAACDLPDMSDAARDVLAERLRHVGGEGWTAEHDDQYQRGQLASAAGCYAMFTQAYPAGDPPNYWPWDRTWWKPTTTRRNLVKAAALILAEIERLDREEV